MPRFFLLLVLCAVAAAAAWFLALRPPAPQTVRVERGLAVEAIYATAVVEPVHWAAVAPVKTGRITAVSADEGDAVKAGDVLAQMDTHDLQAQIREEQALERYQARQVERAEKVAGTGAISPEGRDQRKAALAQSRARIAMLEAQASQMALIAPMDGVVLWRDVEPGETKAAGEPVFWVGVPRPLRLEAEVDEEDIPRIRPGQDVLITADAFPGETLEGTVSHISPKGNPVNKSYRVYIILPDDTKLMTGMTVETNTIVRRRDDALLVPTGAVAEGPAVWRAAEENGRAAARRTPVTTGISGPENTEILEGLREGDIVLLPPFDGLEDGAAIRMRAP